MEEISSLDSFQTDEANSSARPESENTQHSYRENAGKNRNRREEEGGEVDDFDQISEGTFEVDENSRATSGGPPPDENTEGGGNGARGSGGGGESRDFEEVDANVSANVNQSTHEESDMLGEADNTLPQSGDEDDNAMDVDQAADVDERNDNEQEDESMEPLQHDAEGDEEDKGDDVVDADQHENSNGNEHDDDKDNDEGEKDRAAKTKETEADDDGKF